MLLVGYIKLAISFIAIVSIIYIPILFIFNKSKGIIRQLSYLALFFSISFIVFVTIILFGIPITLNPEQHFLNLVPFERFKEEEINFLKTIIAEIIPNIIIFVPLGTFIPVVFGKMRKVHKTALIVFLVTFSVEFFQYFIGRKSDIDDIITNLIGGIIGYGIFKVLNYLFKDKKMWNKLIGNDIT